jgi:hypothetical protein
MTSLTESSLIFDMMNPKEPKKNDWSNRVYLCYEDTSNQNGNRFLPIKGFKCYRYNNLVEANSGLKNKIKKDEIRHAIIPICKWVPDMFDKYILNWKLRNMYWLGRHIIYRKTINK